MDKQCIVIVLESGPLLLDVVDLLRLKGVASWLSDHIVACAMRQLQVKSSGRESRCASLRVLDGLQPMGKHGPSAVFEVLHSLLGEPQTNKTKYPTVFERLFLLEKPTSIALFNAIMVDDVVGVRQHRSVSQWARAHQVTKSVKTKSEMSVIKNSSSYWKYDFFGEQDWHLHHTRSSKFSHAYRMLAMWDFCEERMWEWACNHQLRPLHFAVLVQANEAVRVLACSCDINEVDESRWQGTLLHLAARQDLLFACALLIGAGADVSITNAAGVKPLDKENCNIDCAARESLMKMYGRPVDFSQRLRKFAQAHANSRAPPSCTLQ